MQTTGENDRENRSPLGPRVVLFVALSLLVLCELGAGFMTGVPQSAVTVMDPRLGFRKLPNQHFVGPRGVGVHINSSGYRDREWSDPESENVFRVALLGQSMTYGAYVEIEQSFGRMLEARLQERFRAESVARRVEVMNFAIPGYRLEQMVRTYEDHAQAYDPKLVIIATTAHDIQIMPTLPQSGPGPVSCWVKRRALTRVLSHLIPSFVRLPALRPMDAGENWEKRRPLKGAGDPGIVKRPFAPVQEPKWELARQALSRLRERVVGEGGKLIVLCLPMLENVHDTSLPNHVEIWKRWAADSSGVTIIDGAPPLRAAMLDLLAEVQEKGRARDEVWRRLKPGEVASAALDLQAADQSVFLLFDPFHLSPRGHRVLAEWLDGEITDQSVIQFGGK